MKIDLRNVKINLQFSQETTQFKADVYVDDIKTAYAMNEGFGGPTNYNAYAGQHDRLKAAEGYCESLPPIVINLGTKFEIKSNLEHVIDDLLEKASVAKQVEKSMKKGIVTKTGNETDFTVTSWKGKTLVQMLSTPDGKAAVKQQVAKLMKEGKTILNTNIPAELL